MRLEITPRLRVFLDSRSHNWQERLCLITFLMLTSSVILAGVPMHILGLVGRGNTTLYAISAIVWATTLAILVLYLRQRVSLKAAMTSFGILTQLTDSVRIVHMAMAQPPGFDKTIVFNQIISLALIIYLVMASLRHIPTIIASISIATIAFAYLEKRMNAESGACEDKTRIAKRAKELNLDAIHDTVHEMARDEARHGRGFEGLFKRYFGEKK